MYVDLQDLLCSKRSIAALALGGPPSEMNFLPKESAATPMCSFEEMTKSVFSDKNSNVALGLL